MTKISYIILERYVSMCCTLVQSHNGARDINPILDLRLTKFWLKSEWLCNSYCVQNFSTTLSRSLHLTLFIIFFFNLFSFIRGRCFESAFSCGVTTLFVQLLFVIWSFDVNKIFPSLMFAEVYCEWDSNASTRAIKTSHTSCIEVQKMEYILTWYLMLLWFLLRLNFSLR